MSVIITATLGDGHLTRRNREIEHLEIVSKLGEPHRCTIRFDLDTNFTDCLQDYHGKMSVTICNEDGSDPTTLFEGVMTGGSQDHQLRGGSRFEIRAASPLLLALERQSTPTSRVVDWGEVVSWLKLTVVGKERYPHVATGYQLFDESGLDFVRRMADGSGYFVIERDGKVELRTEFVDDKRRELIWGHQLLSLRASSELVNNRFQGGAFDPATKSDYRFRDQTKVPAITGAIALANAVKGAAASFANDFDPNYLLWDSRTGTKPAFREALLQESERTLGSAVTIEGESRDFLLKLGETIQTVEGASFPLPGSVGVFGLMELSHIWNASEYRNRFTATPWKNFSSAVRPPRPLAPGPFLAEVEATTPAQLANGLIRVRLAATMPNAAGAGWLARLVSPFAGHQRGFVFVPEPHDEVLVAFVQGDPEHPYVIGSLWSPVDKSPGIEPKQIVTKSGNVLAMHDDGWIEIYTPEGKCMLQMSSKDNPPRVTLHSEGDLILEAKGEIQLRAASLHEHISGGVKRKIGGDVDIAIGGSLNCKVEDMVTHQGATVEVTGGPGKLSLTDSQSKLSGAITVISGDTMAVVTGGTVQLNPPVVPPEVTVLGTPPKLPDELKSSWGKRNKPDETPKFDSAQDPPPSGS